MPTNHLPRQAPLCRVRLAGVLLLILVIVPSLVIPMPGTLIGAAVVRAAEAPGAQIVPPPPVIPAAPAAISPLRRQPFEGTLVTTPTVSYDQPSRTIIIDAGRLTLPTVRQMLLDRYAGTGLYTETLGLLTETAAGSKVWELTANLNVHYEASLEITDATATWLRLVSSASLPTPNIRNSGYLLLRSTKITSWDQATANVDLNPADGRGYIFTSLGGRTDLYSTEAAYLGWTTGDGAGLSWRRRRDAAIITSGATGDVHDSNLHDNFMGIQTEAAFGLWVARSQVTNSGDIGIDNDNQSTGLIIEGNTVTGSRRHGISLSRNSYANTVRGNTVTSNGLYGIIVERRSGTDAFELNGTPVAQGTNQILNNTVSQNGQGIVIFQASGNAIDGNTVSANGTGIRLSATPLAVPGTIPSSLTQDNLVANNQVFDNTDYGIMLYAGADRNTIRDNSVRGNGRRDGNPTNSLGSGIYLKSGGNMVGPNNLVFNNGQGISLVAVDAQGQLVGSGDEPAALASSEVTVAQTGLEAGTNNTVTGNHIYGNKDRGVRMSGADHNTVQNNEIDTNGGEGIYSDGGSFNLFDSNYIHANGPPSGQTSEGAIDPGADGVQLKGINTVGNQLTKNRITANGRDGVRISTGANSGIAAPAVTTIQTSYVQGTALPGATVEVFSDPRTGCGVPECGDEAANIVGTTTAGADGTWRLNTPTVTGYNYTATQTDSSNNSSELSRQVVAPTVSVAPGRKGEPTLYVSGLNANLTLAQIKTRLSAYSQQVGRPDYANLITDDGVVDGKRTWTLHISLFISPTVTLAVRGGAAVPDNERVEWLRLFSIPGPDPTPDPADPDHPIYDATKFGTLKTYNGDLFFEDTKVTSWDTVNNRLDEERRDGRAFVLAKYDSEMSIIRSDMSYLGYADGEAYGVSWRDVNSSTDPLDAPRRTRVTGQVVDSIFSHNYYGIYTFQARDMVFRNNKLFSNIQYGFDPHDFTHDVLVEGNEAYDNGSHGFIISRGCSNFVFRNNISRDNKVKPGSKNPSAHAFMLDPGADFEKAGVPQVPSIFNLIENNQAYGNDGYAVRVYGSDDNIIRNNTFYNNRAGITLEKGSTRNTVAGNSITDSTGEPVVDPITGQTTTKGGYGVYAFQGADGNIIEGNTITGNINTGIYLKTGGNSVRDNQVTNNRGDGIGTLLEVESELRVDPPEVSASADAALVPGAYIADQEPGEWSLAAATTPVNNTITGNTVASSGDSGIALKGASGTRVEGNTIASNATDGIYIANGSVGTIVGKNAVSQNGGYGIKVNGPDVQQGTLTLNLVTTNRSGGIAVTGGANGGIPIPRMVVLTTDVSRMPEYTGIAGSWVISGTAIPGTIIELYSDAAQQAAVFEGTTQADERGLFTFITEGPPEGAYITATATNAAGNTSALSKPAKKSDDPWVDGAYLVYLPQVRTPK